MKSRRRLLVAPLAVGAVVLSLALAAGLVVTNLEDSDAFCVSCHTTPEVTFRDRAQAAITAGAGQTFADLSSAHYGMATSFRCIDCHRGDQGLLHRITTLGLGARDTAIWLAGRADPTVGKTSLAVPHLLNTACTECHAPALLEVGFSNHFHNKLPEADALWRGGAELRRPADTPDLPESAMVLNPSPTDVRCIDCHRAHVEVPGSELQSYLDLTNAVYPACVRCHKESGHGPLELALR